MLTVYVIHWYYYDESGVMPDGYSSEEEAKRFCEELNKTRKHAYVVFAVRIHQPLMG